MAPMLFVVVGHPQLFQQLEELVEITVNHFAETHGNDFLLHTGSFALGHCTDRSVRPGCVRCESGPARSRAPSGDASYKSWCRRTPYSRSCTCGFDHTSCNTARYSSLLLDWPGAPGSQAGRASRGIGSLCHLP